MLYCSYIYSWRILKNRELDEKYTDPNIVQVMKRRRLNWAAHVARMDQERIIYTAFAENIKGRRLQGRPRLMWIDNIMSDVESIGIDPNTWTDAAADRHQWFQLVEEAFGR
ncbi:hypothetical protein WDU94_009697 [Cyamophila willieti]